MEDFHVLHFDRFTCKVIKQLLESCGRLGEGGTGKHVFSVVRLLSARSTVGPFLQSGPEKALPVRHDVLGEVEEGAFLRWCQAPCPDHAPADVPVYLWGLLFLISFDQDRGAVLVLHMGDAPLQEDPLPLPGGDVEELALPLPPHLHDRCEEVPGEVGGFLDGVYR